MIISYVVISSFLAAFVSLQMRSWLRRKKVSISLRHYHFAYYCLSSFIGLIYYVALIETTSFATSSLGVFYKGVGLAMFQAMSFTFVGLLIHLKSQIKAVSVLSDVFGNLIFGLLLSGMLQLGFIFNQSESMGWELSDRAGIFVSTAYLVSMFYLVFGLFFGTYFNRFMRKHSSGRFATFRVKSPTHAKSLTRKSKPKEHQFEQRVG